MESYLTPALIIGLVLFVWRDLRKEMGDLRKEIGDLRSDVRGQGERLARIEGRLDPAPRVPSNPK